MLPLLRMYSRKARCVVQIRHIEEVALSCPPLVMSHGCEQSGSPGVAQIEPLDSSRGSRAPGRYVQYRWTGSHRAPGSSRSNGENLCQDPANREVSRDSLRHCLIGRMRPQCVPAPAAMRCLGQTLPGLCAASGVRRELFLCFVLCCRLGSLLFLFVDVLRRLVAHSVAGGRTPCFLTCLYFGLPVRAAAAANDPCRLRTAGWLRSLRLRCCPAQCSGTSRSGGRVLPVMTRCATIC